MAGLYPRSQRNGEVRTEQASRFHGVVASLQPDAMDMVDVITSLPSQSKAEVFVTLVHETVPELRHRAVGRHVIAATARENVAAAAGCVARSVPVILTGLSSK